MKTILPVLEEFQKRTSFGKKAVVKADVHKGEPKNLEAFIQRLLRRYGLPPDKIPSIFPNFKNRDLN